MKNILTLYAIPIFMIGCKSTTSAADRTLKELEEKYNKTKAVIVKECILDARFVARLARQRDAGVPQQGVVEWVIKSAEREEKNPTMNPPITTADVLYQVTLVMWVYSNHKLTPEEIFDVTFKYCTDESIQFLDYVYDASKQLLKEQK